MANSPSYNKYHEWRDNGFPYDVGVTLLRELRIFPHFAKLCMARRNKDNEKKLKSLLEQYLAKVPGVMPGAGAGTGAVAPAPAPGPGPAPVSGPAPAPAPAPAPLPTPSQAFRLQTMAAQQAASTLPPKAQDVVPLHSLPRVKHVPFDNLPEVLKPGRMQAIADMREREQLHAALLPVPAAAQCIHFRDAMRIIEQKDASGQPVPFTLKRFTYNRKTRQGGELLTVHQAVLLTEAALPNPRPYVERQASRKATGKDPSARHRPGDHWKNATRNFLLPDGSMDKCIIWLIVEVNGQRVVMGQNPVASGSGQEAGALCRRIVQLSDSIDAHFDACRLWVEKGVLPFVPEDLEAKLRAYTPDQQDRHEKNVLNPAIYRANKALKLAEGEARVMWERKLNEALQGRAILAKLREDAKAKGEQATEALLAKSADAKAKKNAAERKRKAQKKSRGPAARGRGDL